MFAFSRLGLAALCAGSILVSAPAVGAQLRSSPGALRVHPNPQATVIEGSGTGALLIVSNAASSPLNVFGVAGVVTSGPYGIGLVGYGANSASGNIGVAGEDIGPGGYGMTGVSSYVGSGQPTSSTQTTGVLGTAAYGSGVVGETTFASTTAGTIAGVSGVDETTSYDNDGVLGSTTNGNGVRGVASGNGTGVYATSSGGEALAAYSTAGTGYGIYALSNDYSTIEAYNSANGDGVYGRSNGNGYGVYGYSTGTTPAIGAENVGGANAIVGESGADGVLGIGIFGVVGQAFESGVYPLAAANQGGTIVWYVDDSGNTHTGAPAVSTTATQHGYVAESYAAQSTSRTLEDVGNAELINGAAVVTIDPAFAETIDPSGYAVFVTPDGDCRGLYVAQKTATTFTVRELQGGHSTLALDYRIVAHPYAHVTERMRVAASRTALGWPVQKSLSRFTHHVPTAQRALPPAAPSRSLNRPAIESQLSQLRAP